MIAAKPLAGTLFAMALCLSSVASATEDDYCQAPTGQWLDPATGEVRAYADVLAGLDDKRVILLGETHTRADHHQWQLQMMSALRARRGDLIVGFESFPRKAQPVLDKWTADELSVAEFLEQTDWRRVWNFDPALYLPMFEFARMNRQDMLALNVDQSLIRRVGRDGWAAVPEADRAGLTDPAPISKGYEDFLWSVYESHPARGGDDPDKPKQRDDEAFQRFIQVQQTWDRAMAEAIAGALTDQPDRPVIGVLGMGHVQGGWGVPHQLAAMGIEDVAMLLPWTRGEECEILVAGVADTVFMMRPPVERSAPPPRPRLGILIGDSADPAGVEVRGVSPDSVASAAGLLKDDVIVEAAGRAVTRTPALIGIVQRQAPGTWLPLAVQRSGERVELIAKFPSRP